MKKLYRRLYSREEGFTLVELMIVIIILAILTAIAVPSYMVLRNRARVAAVSYTHLDVYKRQILSRPAFCAGLSSPLTWKSGSPGR